MIDENPLLARHKSIDMETDGTKSKIIDAGSQKFIFIEHSKEIYFPAHSHGNTEWGICIEGEIDIEIDGVIHYIRKGDHFFVGANVLHSAQVRAGYKAMLLVDCEERYNVDEVELCKSEKE